MFRGIIVILCAVLSYGAGFGQVQDPPDYRWVNNEISRSETKARREIRIKPSNQGAQVSTAQATGNSQARLRIDPSSTGIPNTQGKVMVNYPLVPTYPETGQYESFVPYSGDIDANGNALFNYSIPLPHTGGVFAPQLSLGHQPMPTTTVAGVGMVLNGFSVISRSKTGIRHFDKNYFDEDEDHFVLNGQRLYTSASLNHDNETTLFMEGNGYSMYVDIESDNRLAVHYESGVLEYYDDLIGDKRHYHLTQRIDKNENHIDYTYYVNESTKNVVLVNINYGGNMLSGVPHSYEVDFHYDRLVDAPIKYAFGSSYKNSERLDKIRIKSHDRLFREIELDYVFKNGSLLNLPYGDGAPGYLYSITEIMPSGAAKPPIHLEWNWDNTGHEDIAEGNFNYGDFVRNDENNGLDPNLLYNIVSLDYDNDGYQEKVYIPIPRETRTEDVYICVFDYSEGRYRLENRINASGILYDNTSDFKDPDFVFIDSFNRTKWLQGGIKPHKFSSMGYFGSSLGSFGFDFNHDGSKELVLKKLTGNGQFELYRYEIDAQGLSTGTRIGDLVFENEFIRSFPCEGSGIPPVTYKPTYFEFVEDVNNNGQEDLVILYRDIPSCFSTTEPGSSPAPRNERAFRAIVITDSGEVLESFKFIESQAELMVDDPVLERYWSHVDPKIDFVSLTDMDHDGNFEFRLFSRDIGRSLVLELQVYSSSSDLLYEDAPSDYMNTMFDAPGFEDNPILTTDFNGDGNADLMSFEDEVVRIIYGKGDGTFSLLNFEDHDLNDKLAELPNQDYNKITNIYQGDFDGNGQVDYAVERGKVASDGRVTDHIINIFYREGNKFSPEVSTALFSFSAYDMRNRVVTVLDFNGDGREDFHMQSLALGQGGEPDEFGRDLRLMDFRDVTTGEDCGGSYNLMSVNNKNTRHQWKYLPNYVHQYENGFTGQLMQAKFGGFQEEYAQCGVNNWTTVVDMVAAAEMEVHRVKSSDEFQLVQRVRQRYGQDLFHREMGWLGKGETFRYTENLNEDVPTDKAFQLTHSRNKFYTADCGNSYRVFPDHVLEGFVADQNAYFDMQSNSPLVGIYPDYSLSASTLPLHQRGIVELAANYRTDYETNDQFAEISNFSEGRFTSSTKTVNDVTVSSSEVTLYDPIAPDYWYRPILPKIISETTYCYSGDCDQESTQVVTNNTYDNQGRMTNTIATPNLDVTAQISKTVETYAPNGRILDENTLAAGKVISNSYSYDETGHFLLTKTNTLGDQVSYAWNKVYGAVVKKTNANNLSAYTQYDDNGRLVAEIDARGNSIQYQKAWALDAQNVGEAPCFSYTQSGANMPTQVEFTNFQGNVITAKVQDKQTNGFIYSGAEYDYAGRKTVSYYPQKQENYRTANNIAATQSFDFRGRATGSAQYRSGTQIASSSVAYGTEAYTADTRSSLSHTSTTTSSSGRTHKTIVNALGQTLQVADNLSSVTMRYGAFGKPTEITPPSNEAVSLGYDNWGQQNQLTDPDFGTMTYTYNALGELVTQGDGEDTYTMQYDDLGREINKIGTSGDRLRTFYNQSGQNKGQVASVTTHNGNNEIFTYDYWGNLTVHTQLMEGGPYQTTTEYDTQNRPTKETHPSGVTLTYEYHPEKGYLESIRLGSEVLWEFGTNDAFGNTTGALRNNGKYVDIKQYDAAGMLTGMITRDSQTQIPFSNWEYKFEDASGNLEFRRNRQLPPTASYRTEYFSYDVLDRLTEVRFDNKNATPVMVMEYDVSGNIVSKSDVHAEAGGYKYGGTEGFGPHAVKSIVDLKTAVLPIVNQNIIYDGHHQPMQINYDKAGATGNYQFSNGADNQRRQMQSNGGHWMEGGYEVSRKTYLGSEEWLQTGSTQRYIHYVSSPAGLAAIITGEVGNSESQEIYYPVTDYLGSIIMLLDSDGNVVEERSYDAWGRLRNPSFWDDYQVNELAVTNRGYTFHEHLLDAGLINMNGRLYDPLTGRMLSPDNYVQNPNNPQNYNRYSYVLNNPLKYTDPTGEIIPFVLPFISWSRDGGLDISLTVGIGIPGVSSAQITIGHNFGSDNTYVSLSATLKGVTAYASYGSQSGFTVGLGYGIPGLQSGFTTNLSSAGVSYNQHGGFSANAFGASYGRDGLSLNASLGYGYPVDLKKKDPNGYLFASSDPPGTQSDTPGYDLPMFEVYGKKPKSFDPLVSTFFIGYPPNRDVPVKESQKDFASFARKANIITEVKNNLVEEVAKNSNTGAKGYLAVSKTLGRLLGAYGYYDTWEQHKNGEITHYQRNVEYISNTVGFLPYFGLGWSIGWELGKHYGPSKWYGNNDTKWFE